MTPDPVVSVHYEVQKLWPFGRTRPPGMERFRGWRYVPDGIEIVLLPRSVEEQEIAP